MSNDIRKAWQVVRPRVKNVCTFSKIKDIFRSCGLPIEKLSHLEQKSFHSKPKGASKDQLLDGIENIIDKEVNPYKSYHKFLKDFYVSHNSLQDKIDQELRSIGWYFDDGFFQQVDMQVEGSTHDLSAEIKKLLLQANQRYTQSDYSGATTSICSAVDSLTGEVYKLYELENYYKNIAGDIRNALMKINYVPLNFSRISRETYPLVSFTMGRDAIDSAWQEFRAKTRIEGTISHAP